MEKLETDLMYGGVPLFGGSGDVQNKENAQVKAPRKRGRPKGQKGPPQKKKGDCLLLCKVVTD